MPCIAMYRSCHSAIAPTLGTERTWHDSVALTEYLLYVQLDDKSAWRGGIATKGLRSQFRTRLR